MYRTCYLYVCSVCISYSWVICSLDVKTVFNPCLAFRLSCTTNVVQCFSAIDRMDWFMWMRFVCWRFTDQNIFLKIVYISLLDKFGRYLVTQCSIPVLISTDERVLSRLLPSKIQEQEKRSAVIFTALY